MRTLRTLRTLCTLSPKVRNRRVEHGHELADVGLAIIEMIGRPGDERTPRTFDECDPDRGIARLPDLVQRLRDLVRQFRIVILGLRFDVAG